MAADRRIEPKLAPARLAGVPDRHDLLRIGDSLALGLGALGFLGGSGDGTLAFLCSAVRTHGQRLSAFQRRGQVHATVMK